MRTCVAVGWVMVASACSSLSGPVDAGSRDGGDERDASVDSMLDAGRFDAGCQKDLDCACPTPLCDLPSGVCRAWGTDGGPVRINPPVLTSCCSANPPGGKSCAAPLLLPIWQPGEASGIAGNSGSLPTDDERGSCSRSGAEDRIYLLRLCESRNVAVQVGIGAIPDGSALAYVRRGVCQGPELICRPRVGQPSWSASFTLNNLPPDDYYLIVDDSLRGSGGSVSLGAPGCSGEQPLALDGGVQSIDLQGRTSELDLARLRGDLADETRKPERALRFSLPTASKFHARVSSPASSRLAIFDGECGETSLTACAAASSLDLTLDAGSYVLVVEPQFAHQTAIELEAWLEP